MKMQACTLSQASSPSKSWSYHVFLSFRGEDTRKRFTDHLLAALERKGITTFMDEKDIEKGEHISTELLKAIEESMFAIIILSPNYASSTWCLNELQKVVECKNSLGLTVIPVFYEVDPSDVRHQRGSFGEAFRKHEQYFQRDKVESWRDALRQAASYSGWDSKDWYEAKLVESIAQDIHKKLTLNLPSCSENLVGIVTRVEEVNKLICMGLDDVRFIGIGKTTISRVVYEEAIKGNFEVTCFLENVGELSETECLVHLQKTLLSHLNVNWSDFSNLHDGRKTIQNSLSSRKVLVFDDENEVSQLENLGGKKYWFGPGRRVIVTTKDIHLLKIRGVHGIYEVGGSVQNEEGYLDLSKDVVKYSGGHPLALEFLIFFIQSALIFMIHSLIQFGELPSSDPNLHLNNFLELYDTIKYNGASYDAIRLFSLRDKANQWSTSLFPGFTSTWAQFSDKFMDKYFPPSKFVKLRNDILAPVIKEKNFIGNPKRERYDPHSSTYNYSWRDRPNHSWGNLENTYQSPEQHAPSHKAPAIMPYIDKNKTRLQSHEVTMKSLKIQIRQPANLPRVPGSLPWKTKPSPKEQVNMITSRSGKQLITLQKKTKVLVEKDTKAFITTYFTYYLILVFA